MRKVDSIISYIDYGKIVYNIKPLVEKNKLTKSQIVKKTGLNHQIVQRYMSGNVERFDKEVMAKLCYILDCKLEDIMYYSPPDENK